MKTIDYSVGTKVTDNLVLQIIKTIEYCYIGADHTKWVKIIKEDGTTKINLKPKEFYIISGFKFINGNIHVDDNTTVGR